MSDSNGKYARLKIDFRMFNGRLTDAMKNARNAMDSDEYKREILQVLANNYEFYPETNSFTGALEASYDAVISGQDVYSEPFTRDNITRYANGYYEDGALYVDPIDERGRHYGVYTMKNELTAYELDDRDLRDEIVELISEYFEEE